MHFLIPQRHRSSASLVTAASISFLSSSLTFTPPSFVMSSSSGLMNKFILSVHALTMVSYKRRVGENLFLSRWVFRGVVF